MYNPLVHEQAIRWSAKSNRSKALSFKTQVKAGTLRISVQDPAEARQVMKNIEGAKGALEGVGSIPA